MNYGDPAHMLTLGEARAMLRCSRTTLWRLVRLGYLVQVEVGPKGAHSARITPESMRAYRDRRVSEATPPHGLPLGGQVWAPGTVGALEAGEGPLAAPEDPPGLEDRG